MKRDAAIFTLLFALLSGALGLAIFNAPGEANLDFRAFYCAGAAVRAHADPYRTQPLGRCEATLPNATPLRYLGTVPAPLPPYGLALFSLLARFPFQAARIVWGPALAVAVSCTRIALTRLSRWPASLTFALIAAPLVEPLSAWARPSRCMRPPLPRQC